MNAIRILIPILAASLFLLQPSHADPLPLPSARLALADLSVPGGGGAVTAINVGTAFDLAKAMEGTPGIVKAARFVTAPPFNYYQGVSDSPLTTFPSVGNTFAILSTGNATYASLPNTSESTSSANGGGHVNGDSDYDVLILEVDLAAPSGHTVNCISLEFRFLSEEFPEWVGTAYNDAVIGEPGSVGWSTSSSVIFAPNNFLFTSPNQLVSINGAGQFDMTAAAAAGTTYDGATPHLVSVTPLPPPVLVGAVPHYFV